MTVDIKNKLWLATHLLYPNSSQAEEVFNLISLQSKKDIESNDLKNVFSNLQLIVEKINPIGTNLSFYDFEDDQIQSWRVIYRNSQKSQLLIFVGVFVFNFNLVELAVLTKNSVYKTQFVFQQIFKKYMLSIGKIKSLDTAQAKKSDTSQGLKVSYLFTYENLVDYCLDNLNSEDKEKMQIGFELYPALQIVYQDYLKLIQNIRELKVQKEAPLINTEKAVQSVLLKNMKTKIKEASHLKPKWVDLHQAPKIIAAITLLVSVGLIFVKIKEHFSNKNLTVAQVARPVMKTSQPSVQAEKRKVATTDNIEKKKVEISEGGLYRGSLMVKDIQKAGSSIKEQLKLLQAEKAGEVELGWKKSSDIAYFHYTIPEKNLKSMNGVFNKNGKLMIKYESHARQIPQGYRRFIIEVKEQSARK